MSAQDIFKDTSTWTAYRAVLQVRDKLIGGIPLDADTIKKWLAARLELGDRELIEMSVATEAELSDQLDRRPTADEVLEAVTAKHASGNGFKKVDGQLVWEGRCAKAALKEAANVAYPGTKWPGKPEAIRKGLMRFISETVFVDEQYISLGVEQPTSREERIKHVMTPQGPRSAINVVDFVEKPTIEFTVRVMDDCLKPEVWGRIWSIAQEIGIGADRARSDGKFDLIEWKKIKK